MKKPIIVVNRNTPRVIEVFSRLGEVRALRTEEVTKEAVRDADVLIVRSETKVNSQLLEGSAVRFVGTVTIGTDHIDAGYLAARNIPFVSAPGSNSNSVAEYCAAALLVWSQRTGVPLKGKTLGIVGVGHVGSKVEMVGRAFGMTILLNDPPLARQTSNSPFRPLDDLMTADVITLHVPLTSTGEDATYHLMNESRMRKMKKGAVLMNTSRGPVVDSSALHVLLESRHLSSAILDVWEGEPMIDTQLLEKVMIGTPHIAGYSLDGKLNAVRMVYEAVCRFFGMEPDWKDSPLDAAHSSLRIDESLDSVEAVVHQVVRRAYDIDLDDHSLRQMISMTPEKRGSFFMELRAEYRTRQEFSHWAIELPPRHRAVAEILDQLGFIVTAQNARNVAEKKPR